MTLKPENRGRITHFNSTKPILGVRQLETITERQEYGTMKINARRFTVIDETDQDEKQQVFPVWTAMQDCEMAACVAAHTCPYLDGVVSYYEARKTIRHCQVMSKYLKMVESMLITRFGKDLTEVDLFRVGIHLIPLYKQLIRFKIIEMSISTAQVGEVTRSGTTKMHGLFREIREVLKSIDMAWREIGISKEKQPAAPDIPKNAKKDYYEIMEGAALREQKAQKAKDSKLVKRSNSKKKTGGGNGKARPTATG
jgi:hypothetical protein